MKSTKISYVNLDNEKDKLLNQKNHTNFEKKIRNINLNFEFVCSVRNFTKNDWKRVVAVFVQGNDWEFTDWPKNETVTSILLKVKGIHIKYSDTLLNENIKNWNIKVLEINRHKRHFDGSVQNEFWNQMEQFLMQPRFREKGIKVKIPSFNN